MGNCIRRCCGCREMKDRTELLRILRRPDGEYVIDEKRTSDGRGAYICKSSECIRSVIKTKALNKSFKSAVPGDIYGELEKIIEDLDYETG